MGERHCPDCAGKYFANNHDRSTGEYTICPGFSCDHEAELVALRDKVEALYDALLSPGMPRTHEAALQAAANLIANEHHYRTEVERLNRRWAEDGARLDRYRTALATAEAKLAAAREEDCKAICPGCDQGLPLSQEPWCEYWHRDDHDRPTSGMQCLAWPIRQRGTK